MSCSQRPRAFTLVELLVVIGVIGLLMSLLLPQLSQAREVARRARCGANLHAMGSALANYASDFNGDLPSYTWGNQAYDLHGTTAYQISQYGMASAATWFCPSNPTVVADVQSSAFWLAPTFNPNANSWAHAGYCMMTPRLWWQAINGGAHPDGFPAWGYLYYRAYAPTDPRHSATQEVNLSSPRKLLEWNPSTYEVAADITTSNSGDFSVQPAGKYTSHAGSVSAKPAGGNSLFHDGHVEWVPFGNQSLNFKYSNGWYYW